MSRLVHQSPTPSSSSFNSSSSHSFVLVSNSDSLNQLHQANPTHNPSRPCSPRKVQSPFPSSSGGQTKENHLPSSPLSSPTKSSNQVKGNTRSYKQIMRPVSPDQHHQSRSRNGNGNGNGNRSRSRSRKVSSVVIESKEWEKVYKQQTSQEVEQEFETMLTDLEIPPALRVKLSAMDPTVKSSMLRGQATLNLSSLADAYGTTSGGSRARSRSPSKSNINPNARGAIPFKGIRKSKSSSSLAAEDPENSNKNKSKINLDDEDDDQSFVAPKRKSLFGASSRSASGGNSSPIASSPSNSNLALNSPEKNKSTTTVHQIQSSPPKNNTKSRIRAASFGKDVLTPSSFRESPFTFATLLQESSSPNLPLPSLKRLRVLLSTESPTWLGEFISNGGYDGLLSRLDEIFEMEWREDVRDDEVLHELLRGLNSLASTPKGKTALSSRFPQPFTKMIDLLFSEKRPGDISTRKLMVELMMSMNDLSISKPLKSSSDYPNDDQNSNSNSKDDDDIYSSIFNSRVPSSSFSLARVSCDPKTSTSFLILLLLLHNPRTPTQDSLLSFLKEAHAQRPFKTYLTEVAGTCRDYFWIFCHSQNRFWRLEDVDVKEVEGPKVPGGMTGGVEFEAMGYLTTHMKLVNIIASRLQDACEGKRGGEAMAAYEFHQMMFASGWERILATIRRSSQVYYAPLHLELARYFYLASLCRFQVPANLSVWFATPGSNKGVAPSLSDQMMAANNLKHSKNSQHAITPIPNNGSPQILNLPKMEPLNLGLEQERAFSASASPERQQSPQPPIQNEKVRRELPTPPQQSSPVKGSSILPVVEKSASPIKSTKTSKSDSTPLESSVFSPSSKSVEQPFSSGRWMSNGKGLSSSPPKSLASKSISPERFPHAQRENSSSVVDPRVVSGSVKNTSPQKSSSSSRQQAPSSQQSSHQQPNGNVSNNDSSSPISLGSPLPNPFDRFYPQSQTQPLSPQFSNQNAVSPRQVQASNFTRDTEMGPVLLKRGAQDSVVGTAIKRWEMRAQEVVPNQNLPRVRNNSSNASDVNRTPAGTGLGLGWAGNSRS